MCMFSTVYKSIAKKQQLPIHICSYTNTYKLKISSVFRLPFNMGDAPQENEAQSMCSLNVFHCLEPWLFFFCVLTEGIAFPCFHTQLWRGASSIERTLSWNLMLSTTPKPKWCPFLNIDFKILLLGLILTETKKSCGQVDISWWKHKLMHYCRTTRLIFLR